MKSYPDIIPVFPLSGVIYFPKTHLPLNIFEQRYINLVNDAYNKNKLMGMVQSKKENNLVYKIGCLGKISDYQDGTIKRTVKVMAGMGLETQRDRQYYRRHVSKAKYE